MQIWHPASVDIGSHSTLLLIADWVEYSGARRLEPKIQRAEVIRLGESVQTEGIVSDEKSAELRQVLLEYRRTAHALGARILRVVMTDALRRAQNALAVQNMVEDVLGVTPEILSGECEARYAWKAVAHWHGESLTVVDIGGGSTEISNGNHHVSLPVGVLSLRRELGVIPGPEYKKWAKEILAEVNFKPFAKKPVIFVGGTAVALGMLHLACESYDWRVLEGLHLGEEDLDRVIQRLSDLSAELRAQLPGLEHGRSEVVICGLYWMRSIAEKLKAETVRVSTMGIRLGILLDGAHC